MKFLKKSVFVLLVNFQLVFSDSHTAFNDRMRSDDDFESDKRMYHRESIPYHKNEFQREINLAKRNGVPVTAIENMEANTLTAHNNARSRHENTGMLSYNKELEKHALAYAMKLARTDTFAHDTAELKRYGEGENLYMGQSEVLGDICDAVFAWYNEIMEFKYELSNYYNFYPISPKLGHFTQMVWADTTEVGCAGAYRLSVNQGQGKYVTYIVCRYKSPGNVLFKFTQNVHKLKASSPGYFSSFKEVCGAGCVDKKPDWCASKKNDCNRGFFGPVIKKDCPKTCNVC
jgi:hypothetical protein